MDVVIDDWDGRTKDTYWRKAMSDLKMEIMKYEEDLLDLWILRRVHQIPEPCVVFVDIREPESIEKFKKSCMKYTDLEAKAVLMRSRIYEEHPNPSDDSIENYKYDLIFYNPRLEGEEGNDAIRELAISTMNFINRNMVQQREWGIGLEISSDRNSL